jgi:hypothetical protein
VRLVNIGGWSEGWVDHPPYLRPVAATFVDLRFRARRL